MSKVILAIFAFTCISLIFSKNPWDCDSAGRFKCSPYRQTCCRSAVKSSGWACFDLNDGVCCSDGINACPKNFVCNLRDNRCDRGSFQFLENFSGPSGTDFQFGTEPIEMTHPALIPTDPIQMWDYLLSNSTNPMEILPRF